MEKAKTVNQKFKTGDLLHAKLPSLQYSSTLWNPHSTKDMKKTAGLHSSWRHSMNSFGL